MKRISPLPLLNGKYLASIIGFGLYWAWVDCTYFRELLYQPTSQSDFSLAVIHLVVLAVALLLSTLFLFGRVSVSALYQTPSLVVYTSFSTLASILLVVSSYFPSPVWLIPSVCFGGIGMGLGALLWGYRISSFGIEGASVCVPGSIVAAALFGALVNVLIPLAGTVVIALFPLLSVVMIPLVSRISASPDKEAIPSGNQGEAPELSGSRDSNIDSQSTTFTYKSLLKIIPPHFLVILFSFCAAFGLMQYLLVLPYADADLVVSQNILVRGAISLVVLIGFGVFSWKPDVAYKIGLLLITAGFLAAPFTQSIAFSSVIITAGYTCFDMMGWIVVASLMSKEQDKGLRIVALARIASLGGVCAGGIAGSLLTTWAWSSETNMAIATTAIAYLLVAATVLLFNQGTSGVWQLIRKVPAPPDAGEVARKEALIDLAEAHRLTPRETEVMGYLALGRSIPWIAEHLGVSSGTVRSHTRHIYEKLQVHSRQDLLDTVDSEAHKSASPK